MAAEHIGPCYAARARGSELAPTLPEHVQAPGMIRGREFGSAGLAIAVLALALALLPGWISPAPDPAAGSWENGWMVWLGRRTFGLPPAVPTDPAATPGVWRQGFAVSAAVLGFVALVLGIVSFVRREDARLTGCCVGVAAGAIATQHPFTALVIMGFAVLTSAVLARHG
jgi:hypothetical protein